MASATLCYLETVIAVGGGDRETGAIAQSQQNWNKHAIEECVADN